MSNKEQFEKLVREYINRDGIELLLEHLSNTDFYYAPASTKYHDSEPEGLVYHSLKVFDYLLDEVIAFNHEISLESVAICALFHDLCKIGFYTTEMRNTKNEQGKWVQVPYYSVNDLFPYGHGEKSVYMIMQDIKITDEEAIAIRWHMGGFEGQDKYGTMGKAYADNPLAVLLHIADMKATYLP